MKLKSDLTGNKARLLEICYFTIKIAEEELIEKAIFKNIDIEETCDVPQSISDIGIYNSSIGGTLKVNKQLCTDLDKF